MTAARVTIDPGAGGAVITRRQRRAGYAYGADVVTVDGTRVDVTAYGRGGFRVTVDGRTVAHVDGPTIGAGTLAEVAPALSRESGR